MGLTKVVDLQSGLSALLNKGIRIELLQMLLEERANVSWSNPLEQYSVLKFEIMGL